MIRPTSRAVTLFAVGIPPSLIIVIAQPAFSWICMAYAVVILFAMLADIAFALPARALQVDVKPPAKMYIGETDHLALTFRPVRHWRPARIETLLEQRGDLERQQITSVGIKPRESAAIDIPIVPTRRGLAHLDRLWLRWKGPWSLVERTHKIVINRTVEIVPNVRGARNTILRFLDRDAIFGDKVDQKGEGTEFEALREYVPGHDIRFIDWKRSAKHRKPLTKEFRTERNNHIILAFDTGHLMTDPLGGIPRLDHAINASLPLAWVGLRSGDLVGTFGFDAKVRHFQPPLRGNSAFDRIQRGTAQINYHYEETNFTLGLAELGARLQRRALIVIFTDFVDTITAELLIESVQRLTKRHAIVFVTLKDSFLQQTADSSPESFDTVARAVIAQDFLNDRTIVFERLTRMGVHCLDVPKNALSVRLINHYLRIKQRGLL